MDGIENVTIRQRPLGKTGLTIPELILGGGYVGGVLIDPPEEVRREALKLCLDAGSDWIDTARSYADGQSERNIGALLAELSPADRPRISTKHRFDRSELGDPKGAVKRALEASLERLRLEKVEVFQLHTRIGHGAPDWLTPYDILRPGGVADAFAAVQEEGLADFVGITALGDPGPIRDVIASERFQTAQVYYNLLNPSAGHNVNARFATDDFRGVLSACERHGLGVFGIRVLAAGVLATDRRHGRELPVTVNSAPEVEAARAARAFSALGDQGEPRAATAVRFALAESGLSTAVFGAAEIEHVKIALAAQARGPLDDGDRGQILAMHRGGEI